MNMNKLSPTVHSTGTNLVYKLKDYKKNKSYGPEFPRN